MYRAVSEVIGLLTERQVETVEDTTQNKSGPVNTGERRELK
jgi:hypothetical protein